jgi:hypothetical protein
LKSAHSLLLEQVMQHQEENRALKSTVAAMLDSIDRDNAPQQVLLAEARPPPTAATVLMALVIAAVAKPCPPPISHSCPLAGGAAPSCDKYLQ